MQGIVHPPAALIQPPVTIIPQAPQTIVAPSIPISGVPIARPPSSSVNTVAYTPAPSVPAPQAATPEEKIRKLFQLMQQRLPEKYKALFEEVRSKSVAGAKVLTCMLFSRL
jgi:hypothetical protein